VFTPVQIWTLDEGGPDAIGLSCWHGRWMTDGAGTPAQSRPKPIRIANEGEEKDAPFLSNFPAIALACTRVAAVDPAAADQFFKIFSGRIP